VLARPSGRSGTAAGVGMDGMVRRRRRCEHQWKTGRERGKVARAVAHHVARWKRSSTAAVASSLAVVAVPLVASARTRREWGGEALQGRKKKERGGGSGDEAVPFITTWQRAQEVGGGRAAKAAMRR
jgi:hypothetical protein